MNTQPHLKQGSEIANALYRQNLINAQCGKPESIGQILERLPVVEAIREAGK